MTRWEELEQLRERARARGIPVARPQTFRLLLDTVRSLNPERILEIGTAVGCSAAGMLLAAPRARLTGIELQEDCCREARETSRRSGARSGRSFITGTLRKLSPFFPGHTTLFFWTAPKGITSSICPF